MKGVIISAVNLAYSSAEECLDLDPHLWSLWEKAIGRLESKYTPEALESAFIQTAVAAARTKHLMEKMKRYAKEIIRSEPHQEDQYDADVSEFIGNGIFRHYSWTFYGKDRLATKARARLAME
jgi:hypothetical protein